MSAVSSPVATKRGYAGTPQHLKTLDVLGRSKNLQKLTQNDLIAYCELAKTKYYCKTFTEVCSHLEDKYGWETGMRESDLELAWEAVGTDGADISDEEDLKVVGSQSGKDISNEAVAMGDIPVILKANAFGRPILICQVDDDNLHFAGDSGAVGRIFCDPSSLRLDLKGRQYSGQLTAGPTLMVLNLAPPVGQSSSSKAAGLCARAEIITNEYCHLTFEKDLHGTLQGVYTGEDAENRGFERGEDSGSEEDQGGSNRRKKAPASGKKGKAGANTDEAGNIKISTITQRKRKSTGGKKSASSSKKSKSK